MLTKCMSALLISDVPSFAEDYKQLCESVGVRMRTESEWKPSFRCEQDVIILDSSHLDKVNKAYYPKVTVILKPKESPASLIKMGINHFVFDYRNKYELLVALFRNETVVIHSGSQELKTIIKDTGVTSFCVGDYDFKFDKNQYSYKGKLIYLTDSQKEYLADWLLNGFKDNKKRMITFTLRKKFGESFLKDIDRFGNLKGGKKDE